MATKIGTAPCLASSMPARIRPSAIDRQHFARTWHRTYALSTTNQRTLAGFRSQDFYRPVFTPYVKDKTPKATDDRRHLTFGSSLMVNLLSREDNWRLNTAPRLSNTGIIIYGVRRNKGKPIFDDQEGSVVEPDLTGWGSADIQRDACKFALSRRYSDLDEVEARKLCAETKDPRYPTFYHSLEQQAHTLYVIGRMEIEREPDFHILGYYILCVSAGLGQLDAALLLDRLERIDRTFVVQPPYRAVITKAAESGLDWRAMVAQCEHIVSKANGRAVSTRLQPAELEQCIDLLMLAIGKTKHPLPKRVEREAPPERRFDADSMMYFDSPYKLLVAITGQEMSLGNRSERVLEAFETAAKLGTYTYKDTQVAWRYAEFLLEIKHGHYTEEWIECAEMAAKDSNADACFQLAKYYFGKDGWCPSLAARVLNDKKNELRATRNFDVNENVEELVESPLWSNKIHSGILDRRDENLLNSVQGILWMKEAAQLPIENATHIFNRHVIIAGVLRLNGFLDEGREVLLEAQEQLQDCADKPGTKTRALKRLGEYLEYWDQKLIHQLIYFEDIDQLLDR